MSIYDGDDRDNDKVMLAAMRAQHNEMLKQLKEAIEDLKMIIHDHEKRIRYLEKIIVFGVALVYLFQQVREIWFQHH